jgi:hypothetical protein
MTAPMLLSALYDTESEELGLTFGLRLFQTDLAPIEDGTLSLRDRFGSGLHGLRKAIREIQQARQGSYLELNKSERVFVLVGFDLDVVGPEYIKDLMASDL